MGVGMKILKCLGVGVFWILLFVAIGFFTQLKPFFILVLSLLLWSCVGFAVLSKEHEARNKKVIGLSFLRAMKLMGKALLCGPYTKKILRL